MYYLILIDGNPLKKDGRIKCYKTVEQATRWAKEERYWKPRSKIEVAELITNVIAEVGTE